MPSVPALLPSQTRKDPQFGNYSSYNSDNGYSYNPGVLVIPVAGPDSGESVRIVKIHAKIGLRSVSFDASKSNTPPWFPQIATDTPSGDVFIGGAVAMPLPKLSSDQGQLIYSVSGAYQYVQASGPRDSSSIFQTGEYPFDNGLVRIFQNQHPAFKDAAQTNPNVPKWTDPEYKWTAYSIAGFFMDDGLIK